MRALSLTLCAGLTSNSTSAEDDLVTHAACFAAFCRLRAAAALLFEGLKDISKEWTSCGYVVDAELHENTSASF